MENALASTLGKMVFMRAVVRESNSLPQSLLCTQCFVPWLYADHPVRSVLWLDA